VKKLLFFSFLFLLAMAFFTPNWPVTYEIASQDSFRQIYLESKVVLLEEKGYEVPENATFRYVRKQKARRIMSVRYPILENPIEKDSKREPIIVSVYPLAFDRDFPDEFLSVLIHELNHIRALNRQYIIDGEKDYLFIENRKKSSFHLKWNDIFDSANYNREIEDFDSRVRKNVKKEMLEILATGEELSLIRSGSYEFSGEWQDSKWRAYRDHYFALFDELEKLGAAEELKEKLRNIFYQPWLDDPFSSAPTLKVGFLFLYL